MTNMRNGPRYAVKSLDKALSILELMIAKGEDLSITEIGNSLGLGKGTVHRILDTLRARNFVQQDPDTKRYGFGIMAFEMASKVRKEEMLRRIMMPALRALFQKCNETVNAAVLEEHEIKYIIRLESQELLRVSIEEGTRFPAHCTATGKMLLSALSDEELKAHYEAAGAFRPRTENSINSVAELMEAIQDIRQRGIAYDFEEAVIGVHCVAAPACGPKNKVVAAISISGPKERLTKEKMTEYSRLLALAAHKISKDLGL